MLVNVLVDWLTLLAGCNNDKWTSHQRFSWNTNVSVFLSSCAIQQGVTRVRSKSFLNCAQLSLIWFYSIYFYNVFVSRSTSTIMSWKMSKCRWTRIYYITSYLRATERDRRFPFNLRFYIYQEDCKKELKAGIFVLWGCLYPLNQANWYWSKRFGNVSFYPSCQANEASTFSICLTSLSGRLRFRTSCESRKDSPAW